MEDIFNKLQKDGKNSVDNLVKWISGSNLIAVGPSQDTEDDPDIVSKVRTFFSEPREQEKVPLDEFKDVIKKFAQDQKKGIDELTEQLAKEGPKVVKATLAGVQAFKKEIAKKD